MRRIFYEKNINNNKGETVLAIKVYEEDGKFYYTAYPCIGINGSSEDYRVILYEPLFINEFVGLLNDTIATKIMNDCMANSWIVKLDKLGSNVVYWNGVCIGMITDVQKGESNIMNVEIVYGFNKIVRFNCSAVKFLITGRFDKNNSIDLKNNQISISDEYGDRHKVNFEIITAT